jgi:ribosomal protein S12 methylthiotransferase
VPYQIIYNYEYDKSNTQYVYQTQSMNEPMPKVYIESLGCARNQVDSEIMMARLAAGGWSLADEPDEAEVILINTCSFIESASNESIDTILALAEYKTQGRCRKLIVTGCLPERYRQDSVSALPEVDLFLGTGAYDQVVAALQGGFAKGTCLLPDPDSIDIQSPVLRKPHASHAAYLKIAEGCSRRCTFCIIPKLRGRQKSRPVGAIVEEAQGLIAGGVKELTLVAQETTAYGHDLSEGGADLAQLLRDLAQLDPSVWIRFLYGHPQTMTIELLRTVAEFANICPYFDIPIQHASDPVLKRMGRSYTRADLLKLFEDIRREISSAALRTTVLVGFPGETEADVNQLAHFMDEVRFDHLGVFSYSDEDDLPSHHLESHVDESISQSRLDRLMALQKEISEKNLAMLDGREMTVMVEKEAEPGIYAARSMYQAPEVDGCVLVRSHQPIHAGTLVTVKIVETLEYDLVGEMV